ncbi:unnamed protein product [Rotaria sp. Silwood1]|nr:unnamed protein product [Rotaria sp. Silwood1]CAF4989807.1 unnamed protein product [Rotaria sp. Silwood1]
MNYSNIGILDLPAEILLIILSKLKNIDVLYSLVGVHERLDRIVCDTIFTRSIDLATILSNNKNDSLINQILIRFCLDILPRIHQNIECLTLEPLFMGCILRISNYPNLHKLNIVKLDIDKALAYFSDESPFVQIFKEKISHLVITITDDTDSVSLLDLVKIVYAKIFALFTSLTHLEFGTYNTSQHRPLVLIFDDCLCLLNGRLYQMKTFIVTVDHFLPVMSNNINYTKGLHNLKCFSLMSRSEIFTYDNQIVPLLRQMTQLEKLTLSLNVYQRTTFIEGTHLNKEILSHMSHLNTFIFDIVTHIVINDDVNQKTIVNIQSTFVQDIDGYIDYYPNTKHRCHIYSLPFTIEYLHHITNNFPGGIFISVRTLSIFDDILPFEHEFFKRISHSFPLLNSLTVINSQQQNEKQTRQLYNNEKLFSIIKFPHIFQLNLEYAHIDYVEQFLFDTNTYLPCLDQLQIQFEHLYIITENFTSNSTRAVCSKIKRIDFSETVVQSKDFYLYFPLL